MFGLHFFQDMSSSGSKCPNKKKTFFENYADHLVHIERNAVTIWDQLNRSNDLCFLAHEAIKRISTFDPLRDGYDYFDELLGATVLPLALQLLSFYHILVAIVEAACAFAVYVHLMKDEQEDHLEEAQKYGMYGMSAFLFSFAIAVKSLISLVTRPIVTAFQGFKEQDVERFRAVDQTFMG